MAEIELTPRNKCMNYMRENNARNPELLPRKVFDEHYYRKDFIDGPYFDSFGDAGTEPYNPWKQAFGRLKSGLYVYCEILEELDERAKSKLEAEQKNAKELLYGRRKNRNS